jgi:hypothetical protein
MSTTPLLRITVYDPGGFGKASSAAAYACKCAELALAELSRNHGTVMSADVIGQTPNGQTNQTLGEFHFISLQAQTCRREGDMIPVITLMAIAALLAIEVGWLIRC